MKLEIREGDAISLGSSTVSLATVQVSPFADREGNVVTRRAAELSVDGTRLFVEEGSVLPVVGDAWRVVRIRRKNAVGIVRVALVEDGWGTFNDIVEEFRNQSSVYDTALMLLVGGIKRIDDVVERIDDHPDVVGTFSDPLSVGVVALNSAKKLLQGASAPSELLQYVERYHRIARSLREVIESSTQERVVD